MILEIIFKKLGWRPNKALMAASYGLFYSLVFFIIMLVSSIYLNTFDLYKITLLSSFVGIMMAIVFLIKSEIFIFFRK